MPTTLLLTLTLGSLNLEWNNPRPTVFVNVVKHVLLNLHMLKCKNKSLVKTTATNTYQIKREARSCRETNLTSSCSQVQNARVHLPLCQKSITTIYLHIFLYFITKYTLLPKSHIFIDTIQCKCFFMLSKFWVHNNKSSNKHQHSVYLGKRRRANRMRTAYDNLTPLHQDAWSNRALQNSCCFTLKYWLSHMPWN